MQLNNLILEYGRQGKWREAVALLREMTRQPDGALRAKCASLQAALSPIFALRHHGCEALCRRVVAETSERRGVERERGRGRALLHEQVAARDLGLQPLDLRGALVGHAQRARVRHELFSLLLRRQRRPQRRALKVYIGVPNRA